MGFEQSLDGLSLDPPALAVNDPQGQDAGFQAGFDVSLNHFTNLRGPEGVQVERAVDRQAVGFVGTQV